MLLTPNVGSGAKKLDHSYSADGNVKSYSNSRKTGWRLLTQLNVYLSYDLVIELFEIYPREIKT